MVDPNDWRLTGQEKYLKGVTLYRKRYVAPRPDWDHDHCEFCWAKFMVEDYPDVFHEGYSTLDEYRWICKGCFDDFKEMFEWRVVRSPDQ